MKNGVVGFKVILPLVLLSCLFLACEKKKQTIEPTLKWKVELMNRVLSPMQGMETLPTRGLDHQRTTRKPQPSISSVGSRVNHARWPLDVMTSSGNS